MSADDNGIKCRGVRDQEETATGNRKSLATPVSSKIRRGHGIPLERYVKRGGKLLSEAQRQHAEGQVARQASRLQSRTMASARWLESRR